MGNKVKRAALAALIGSAAIFGGCLGNGWWQRAALDAALYAGLEYATDADGFYTLGGLNTGDAGTD